MAFLYDYLVKMVVVGDAQVGKSCVVQQYAEGVFTERYITTSECLPHLWPTCECLPPRVAHL